MEEAELLSVEYDSGEFEPGDETLTLNFDKDIISVGTTSDYDVRYSATIGELEYESNRLIPDVENPGFPDYNVADGEVNKVIITITDSGNMKLSSSGYFRVTVKNLEQVVYETATTDLVSID